jgi:hypothetical protein
MITMNPLHYLCASLAACAAIPAFAQSCATPIEIAIAPYTSTRSTCSSTNNLPDLANGAIANQGADDVYRIAVGAATSQQGTATLIPAAGVDLSLFICRGPCGTYATCVAAVDNGAGAVNSAQIPAVPGDYFIVVAHAASSAPSCGNYTLNIAYPLSD